MRSRSIKLITLIVFMTIGTLFISILNKGASDDYIQTIGILGICIMGWCIISSRLLYGKYLTLILMFELSFYLLTAGQSFLCALNIPLNSTLDLYYSNAVVTVNTAYIYTFICIMLFHIGTIFYREKRTKVRLVLYNTRKKEQNDSKTDYSGSMKTCGWILFCLSVIPYLVQMSIILINYRTSGYSIAYSKVSGSTSWSKLFFFFADYFVISLFVILIAYQESEKLPVHFASISILTVVGLNFALGNRSEPICYIIALLWYYKNYSRSAVGKRITTIGMIVSIVVFFVIIPVIGATRNNGTLNLNTISESFVGKSSAIESIKGTFMSMGWSAFPLIKTMQLIPSSFPYHYGISYLFAMLSVIPNLLGGTHISVKYAGLPQWLKTTLNLSFGPGYSFPAEAYYNFGWYGCAIMLLFGNIVRSLLDENIDEDDPMHIFVKAGLFIVLFSVPRREMLTAIRDSVYLIGFVYWGIKLFHMQVKKRHKRYVM